MGVSVPPGYYDTGRRHVQAHTGQVAVGNAPVQVLQYSINRVGVVVTNTSVDTVFVSSAPNVTIGTGHALLAGSSLELSSVCELYAIAALGPDIITYLEEIVNA